MAEVLDQQQSLNNTWAGFGEFAVVRYRGQGFRPTQPLLTAISFQRGAGFNNKGLKVYIDNADTNSFPIHSPEEALYSFVIPNAELNGGALTKYDLPIPQEVTPGAQYVFYLAPWDENTDLYSDDYADARWYNDDVYANGKPIYYQGGSWNISDLGDFDMYFETYGDELPPPPPPIPEPEAPPVYPNLTPQPVQPSNVVYKILVKDQDGDTLGEFDRFRNLKIGKRLNNYGECSFQIPVNDPKAGQLVALRLYTIEVYRNELLLWAGEQAIRTGDLDSKGDNWATIICYDWLEQLNSRYTVNEKEYAYQDGSDIAWDLINETQTDGSYGDLGIVQGTLEATTFREKTYTNQNVMEALISLANLENGFDFEINNSKVFNIFNHIGVDRSDTIFLEYGINVASMRITEDFSQPATRAIILGQTEEVGDAVRVEVNDAAQQAIYKLRESVMSQMEVSELATLEDTGDTLLRKYGEPLLKVSMDIVRSTTPTIADFALGDIIRVIVKTGIYNLDEAFRVFEWTVTYNTDNTETLSLTLGNFNLGEFS